MANQILILLFAAILDFLIGDPWGFPHPVQVMGWFIKKLSKLFLRLCHSSLTQRLAGILLGTILIFGSAIVGWFIVDIGRWIHPIFGVVIEIILLASCFAGKSLRIAAENVLIPLNTEHLETARYTLRNYVGRDTEELSKSEILRAILETVTENAVDGVMAPLFYAILGYAIPFIGPVPLALAYKAASTLDSMVGYKNATYIFFGWFSARFEDGLTWIPCRLTIITLGILSGKPLYVWRICQRDGVKDPSPNSGWSECAYAAILGVQVGGTNFYQGVAKHKPLLGEDIYPISQDKIFQALQLTRHCFLLWLGLAMSLSKLSAIFL